MVFPVMRSKSVQIALILSAILHAVSSYTTFTDCGGELTQQAGVITSPNFPQNYPGYARCSWTITVAQDQVIDLSFQCLDLRRRRDQDCYDYLSVYDGPDQSSPFIENQLCGYQNDSEVADIRLRSTGNQMHLYFYAQSSEPRPGFSASYWAHNACLPFTYEHDDCNTPCACNQNNTLYCNSVDGSCKCKRGWTSSLCTVDIDECRDPNSCPDVYSECVNTEGSFECSCKAGFSKNATGYCNGTGVCQKGTRLEHTGGFNCIDCDDWTFGYNCINNCACNQRNTKSCDKIYGLCHCYLNWTGKNCEEDVNECLPYGIACNTTSSSCSNYDGSYMCECRAGYENVDGNQQSCQECGRVFTEPSGSIISLKHSDTLDTEECSWTIRVADANIISLKVSKFTQNDNYRNILAFYDGGNSRSRLIQRLYSGHYTFSYEETIRSSGNQMHIVLYTTCYNSSGTTFMATYWSHKCPEGMYGEKCEKQCLCNDNTAYCNSITGQCVCKEGWRSENCSVDIDECSEDSLACPNYSDCENLNGSFVCTCKEGLTNVNGLCVAPESSGNLSCTDSSCVPLCVTTKPGTKQCYCPVGMVLNGYTCVEWKNMTYGPDCSHACNCVKDHTASCDSRYGTCTCVTGWTGDMCEEDVNECEEDECGITPCTPQQYSTCHNTEGSYVCTCDYRYGYVKTGKDTCEQIACQEFTYGEVDCDTLCQSERLNTFDCDNVKGWCLCKTGWTGNDCKKNVNECLGTNEDICPENSDCVDTVGSYRCICHPGYVLNHTTNVCDVKNECTEKQCSHSCIITHENEEQCVCPDDLVLDRAKNLTCVVPYYPYGTIHGDNNLRSEGSDESFYYNVSAPILFSPGIPFGTKEQSVAFVLTSGVVLFGYGFVPAFPSLKDAVADLKNIEAPFWARMNRHKGETYYQLYEKCPASGKTSSMKETVMKRAKEDIIKFYKLYGFEVNTMLLVTWEKVEPLESQGDEQNTFQGIYISGWKRELQFGREILSDEQTGYVIFMYQQGMMKWKHVEGRIIEIGTTQSAPIQTTAELLGELPGNTGYNGVLTFEVGSVGGDSQKCHKYVCNHAELLSDPAYEAERNDLYNCPCTLERLGRQWQLFEKRGENEDISCYAISFLAKQRFLKGNKRNKLCCYKWVEPVTQDWYVWEQARRQAPFVTGHVLISDPWLLQNFDNIQALENIQAQQWCCSNIRNTELCEGFYRVFPKQECTNFPDGYTRLNGTCVDINECADPSTNTSLHNCNNSEGGFSCSYFSGYTFDTDNNTFIANLPCPANHSCSDQCINLGGNRTCLCLKGKVLSREDPTLCEDCPDGMWGTNCTNQCQCVETNTDSCNKVNGSCTCKTGWKGDTCSEDINECEEGTVSCPEHSFCNNTDGGFVCVCDDGFFGTDSTDALCKDCPDGMWGTNCTNQCQCVETNTDSCNKVNGSCTCKTGWKGDTCSEDINECEEGTVSCQEHSFCNNTDGGFVCVCDDGFFGTDSTDALCKDCPDGMWGTNCTNQCQCVETNTDSCNKVNGSCTCKTGWKGDTCSEDINECEEGTVSCQEHSFCNNTDGGFVCVCDDGFFGTDSTDALCKDCPDGMWGTNCTNQCQCVETNTDSCNKVNGSCTCKTGWKGDTCSEDINECEEGTVSCSEHSFCNNTDGGFVCVCDDGFFGTDSTDALCKDCPDGMWGTNCTNQCQCVETNTDSCNKVNGSCTCKTGWKGDTCSEDINECEEGTVSCQEHSFCNNTDGGFVCVCDDGFFGTDSTDALCKDCPDGMWGTNCTNQCQCVETNTDSCNKVNGSCTCKTGWKGDTCSEDINECEEGTVSCQEHSFCNNTDGGFVCVCDDGFFGTDSTDALCKDCPDGMWGTNCTNQCQCVETNTDSCNKVNGSCTCKTGWKGDTCSEDINECEEGTVSCSEHSFCNNTDGGFVCVCDDGFFGTDSTDALCKDCPDGMWGTNCTNQCQCVETNTDSCNKVNGSCTCKTGWKGDTCSEDINECEEGTVSCSEHSFCNNTDGGFVCVCDDGFFGTDSTDALCKDCPDGMWGTNCTNQCQCVETNTDSCNKVNGSCTCKTGWKGDTCSEDINECKEGTVSCSEHSFCNNTDGGFVCVCDDGFFGTDSTDALCKDCPDGMWGTNCTNQCQCVETNTDSCNKVNGSCTCKTGWKGDTCSEDINECEEGTVSCQEHSFCNNTDGGFVCVCDDGFFGTDSTDALCKDCPDGMWGTNCTNQCQCVETNTDSCNKVNGSCTCKTGWKGDTCSEDINECEEGTVSCQEHSFCNNTDGGFVCVCDDGYFNTENPDALCKECDRNHYGPSCSLQCACEEYEICDKVDGTCTCMRGLTGPHCKTDVDECHEGTHTCEVSRHEECKNLEEGFDCVCHSGYHRTCPICECTDIDECSNSTHLKHNCSQVCINEEGGFRCDCWDGFLYSETDNTCGEISTHLVETVFEYDTSRVDFTKDSEDMKRLSKDIEEKMTDRLSAQGLTVLSLIVIELREGSLIAPMNIEMVGKTQNSSTELTEGLLQAMDAGPMSLDNKLARIKQINSSGQQFAATDSKCERRQKLEPCTGRRQCVVIDGVARCKLPYDEDDEALILGLEIGLPLFAIVCIVVGATVFHRIRKDKMKDKSVLVRKERGHTGMGDAMRVSTGDDRYKREFASATNPAFSRDDSYLTRASRGSTWLEHPTVNQHGRPVPFRQQIELAALRTDYHGFNKTRDIHNSQQKQLARHTPTDHDYTYIYNDLHNSQQKQVARPAPTDHDYTYIYDGDGIYETLDDPAAGELEPDYGRKK